MMQIITLFILIFFAATFFRVFQLFNIFMDEQNGGKTFFREIKEDFFGKE